MTLEEDDELTKGYPDGIPNRVIVKTKDGGTFTKVVSYPRGHANNKMTEGETEAKFRLNVDDLWVGSQADRVIDLVWHLDEQKALDELMEAIRI